MKLEIDGDRFDELQPWFVGEIIESIKRELEQAGLQGEALKDICGRIAFSVCALIDSSSGFEVEGKKYSTYLAFSADEHSMFYPGGTSYLHEYVFGVLDEVLNDDS